MQPKGYENVPPGTPPDAEGVAKMTRYDQELQRAGVTFEQLPLVVASHG